VPLNAEAFKPFGDVLELPSTSERAYFCDALSNGRPAVPAALWMSHTEPSPGLPLQAHVMERHPLTSQTFIAIGDARWLVMVAPHDADGRPDMARAQAFLAGPGQGITYRADTWHHPMVALQRPAGFAVLMWRDGSALDEEFHDIDPVTIVDGTGAGLP